MVTNPIKPKLPPDAAERIGSELRVLLAGDHMGAVRRIILYLIAVISIVAGMFVPVLIFPALVAVMLLSLTDRLV